MMGLGPSQRENPSHAHRRRAKTYPDLRMDRQSGLTAARAILSPCQVDRIASSVRELTMVPDGAVRFTIEHTVDAISRQVPGVIVECGVWRGGCSIAMLEAQRVAFGRVERPVYMLDSFEGLPPATPRDGPLATQWQSAGDAPDFYDNCRASLAELEHVMDEFCFAAGDYRIIAGWFDETLPGVVAQLQDQGVAVLRLDADWYDPTVACLDELVPLVSQDGLVFIDDYYAWDGCARAVHEYLSRHDMPYRIRSMPDFAGAYFVKKPFRDTLDEV
jgi:O-methyltransferase